QWRGPIRRELDRGQVVVNIGLDLTFGRSPAKPVDPLAVQVHRAVWLHVVREEREPALARVEVRIREERSIHGARPYVHEHHHRAIPPVPLAARDVPEDLRSDFGYHIHVLEFKLET